ncbi:MAG TPA: divalent metal cation transporter, partial [Candidatus Deferrimicrobium sp.]|nr:divalent metal cation transporter [Candidatus Deferrimicrobium sp.]
SQVINGVLLPFVLIFILKLINDRELMGEHVNSKAFNGIAWTTTVVMIVLGGALILYPRAPLMLIMYLSQVINGMLLPFVLIFMLKLINDRELMGEHVNSKAFNGIAWTTTVIMITLTALLVIVTIFPGLPGRVGL